MKTTKKPLPVGQAPVRAEREKIALSALHCKNSRPQSTRFGGKNQCLFLKGSPREKKTQSHLEN